MTTSTSTKTKKKSKFGIGEFIGGILFDLYARYWAINNSLAVISGLRLIADLVQIVVNQFLYKRVTKTPLKMRYHLNP